MKASRLIPLFLLVAGLVTAVAAPAHAHTEISVTAPATGQQLDQAPADVTLTFTDKVLEMGTRVQVIGPGGEGTSGRPVVSGSTVRQALKPGLDDGTYIVNWRAVSPDGHALGGTFTFSVGEVTATGPSAGATAEAATPTPSPVATPTPASGHAHDQPPAASGEDSNGIAGVAYVLGIVALAGILALAVLFERRRSRR